MDHTKISLPPTFDPSIWLNAPNMEFKRCYSIERGKWLECKIRGLRFRVLANGMCLVSGSVHKYRNKGKHNADLFTYNNAIEVFNELNLFYNIPFDSRVVTFEFGTNILLPNNITAYNIIKGSIAYSTKSGYIREFGDMKGEDKRFGKIIKTDNLYFKIYDKGRQSRLSIDNLLRIEIGVRRYRYLVDNNLCSEGEAFTISKLLQKSTYTKLIGILIADIERLLHATPKAIDIKALNKIEERERKDYLKGHYWVSEVTHKNRFRKVNRFRSIYENKVKKRTLKEALIKSLKASTNEIMGYGDTALKSVAFTSVVEYGGAVSSMVTIRKCSICDTDISDKRSSAKYCSKKCSNKKNSQKRTARNRIKRTKEQDSLNTMISNIKSGSCYKMRYLIHKDLHHIAINTDRIYKKDMPYSKYRKITRVEIETEDRTITLTTMRAKEFMKRLSLINNDKR